MDYILLTMTAIVAMMIYSVVSTVVLIFAFWFLTQHYHDKTVVLIDALAEHIEDTYGKRHED